MDDFENHVDALLDLGRESCGLPKQSSQDKGEASINTFVGNRYADEEILHEFMCFMKNLPVLIESERRRLVHLVK